MQRNMPRYGCLQLSVQNNFCLDFLSDKPCCNAIYMGVTGHQKSRNYDRRALPHAHR